MSNTRKLITLMVFIAIFPATVSAAEFRSGERVFIPREETVGDDLYLSGSTIIVEGVIMGDLIAVGGTINITGTVLEDVIAVGGEIHIGGSVGESVRVAGGSIEIDSVVLEDVIAAGGNILINEDIGDDLVAVGGNIEVRGGVGRNLNASGGRTVLSGIVGGKAKVVSDSLTLLSTSKIVGDLEYESSDKAEILEGATVEGRLVHKLPEQPVKREGFSRIFSFLGFLSLLLIGALAIYLAPGATEKVADLVSGSTLKSLGIGAGSLIVVPFFALIIFITIIGIPLAILTLVSYLIALYISKIFVGIAIGRIALTRISKEKSSSPYWSLLVGLVILMVFTATPIFGGLINLVVMILGVGAGLLFDYRTYRELRNKNIV